ncbi:MAG: pyruvate kinase [Nitrospiraceae bacterium]|nr:MAG: pyruvate kinase [Nitrospiraceae bacterium]
MRKVKIVCTIGPATESEKNINRLISSGMNIARLNFSHSTYEKHIKAVTNIRDAARRNNAPVAILQDLRGLKIRVGSLKNGAIILKKNARIFIRAGSAAGDENQIFLSYRDLLRDVKNGAEILIDDGLLRLKVTGRKGSRLTAKVEEGGLLREKKGVNLPGSKISGSVFTRKDMDDLNLGINLGVDYVAMSFVRSGDDLKRVKNWLRKKNADIPVIAKIENSQALENIDDIISIADGLMIARGDLGVELPPEQVPFIQKELIKKCNIAMKPVITATQMLESMTGHSRPTRAEAADVANAVLDGTDALMLSAETSIGQYPVESLKMMDRIIRTAETGKRQSYHAETVSLNYAMALAEAACSSARDIKAKTIVAFSRSGFTALMVSKFRPQALITGFTGNEVIRRKMNLYWGVHPHIMKIPDNTDEMISTSEKVLLKNRIVRKGDSIVIIASSPFALGGKTNIMKLHKVGY